MQQPENLEARGQMLLGAHFAGAAIENSMLGATHATANPLSAHFQTVHGVAVGVMLPHVIRWNVPEVGGLYQELAMAAGWAGRFDSAQEAAESLVGGFLEFLKIAEMPTTLAAAVDREINQEMRQTLATQAAQQWTATFNPANNGRSVIRTDLS